MRSNVKVLRSKTTAEKLYSFNSLRHIERNPNIDVKVDYDVLLYEVQMSDFLHTALGSLKVSDVQLTKKNDAWYIFYVLI